MLIGYPIAADDGSGVDCFDCWFSIISTIGLVEILLTCNEPGTPPLIDAPFVRRLPFAAALLLLPSSSSEALGMLLLRTVPTLFDGDDGRPSFGGYFC